MAVVAIYRSGPEAAKRYAALHAQCFAASWPAEDFERLLSASGVVGLILEADGVPSGLSLIRTIAGECEILTIGVVKGVRQQGLGYQLLTASETEARLSGARRIILEVSHKNTPAIALYERASYIEIGRREAYYRDGSDARVLARRL
jgi:ribosomal-protein-alanine N-acetyltransferase